MADLSTPTARNRLPARKAPHFAKLGKGCALAWYPMSGSWGARFIDGDTRGVTQFDGIELLPPTEQLKAATAAAQKWLATLQAAAKLHGIIRVRGCVVEVIEAGVS